MKTTLFLVPVACLALCGCKKESPQQKPSGAGDNPITAPVDYLGAAGKAHKSALKTLGTVSLDQALKMFFEEKGRNPTNLDELVSSGTLPKLPAPPNGMKFEYDAAGGKVKVVPQ